MESFKISVAIPYVGATIQPGRTGIGCAGFYDTEKKSGVVVIADGGSANKGASATNSMEPLLRYLAVEYGEDIDFSKCQFVEIDSDGCFDYVLTKWSNTGGLLSSWFAPLLYGNARPRSEEAFLAQYGPLGEQLLFLLSQAGPYHKVPA